MTIPPPTSGGSRALVALVGVCLAISISSGVLRVVDGSHLGGGPGPVSIASSPDGRLFAAEFNDAAVWSLDAAGAPVAKLAIPDLDHGIPSHRLVPMQVIWSKAANRALVICHYWAGVFSPHFETNPPWIEQPLRAGNTFEVQQHSESIVAIADGLNGTVLVVMAQTGDPTIKTVELRTYRPTPEWQLVRRSDPITLDPPGYQRGVWPLAVSTKERRIVLGEPGTGHLRMFDADLKIVREATVGHYPFAFALNDEADLLYVGDKQTGSVTAIRMDTLATTSEVRVAAGINGMLLDSAHRTLWVAGEHDDVVVGLDASNIARERARLGGVSRPSSLALFPNGAGLWVAELGAGTVRAWTPGGSP